jgi:hypothetical protein
MWIITQCGLSILLLSGKASGLITLKEITHMIHFCKHQCPSIAKNLETPYPKNLIKIKIKKHKKKFN